MKQEKRNVREVGWRNVEVEIPIEAPRERVWDAIVNEIGAWWRKDFCANPNTKKFVLEPRLGGRMYEDAGDGAGVLWYTVMSIDPPNSLTLSGHLALAFGGPATSILNLNLKSTGKATVLEISDSFFGNVEGGCEKEDGWRLLFGEGLKPFVELSR